MSGVETEMRWGCEWGGVGTRITCGCGCGGDWNEVGL